MRRSRPQLGGGWTLWPQVLVRGAGFPFSLLDEVLRAPNEEWALRKMAAEPRFREAVMWQNRAAVENGLDWLVRKPADVVDSKTRKKLLLVARYLQRYCAKNDTIGFMGPLGWGRLEREGPGTFRPGRELLDARATYFEPWAISALANATRAPSLRLAQPVTLAGDVRLVGSTAVGPRLRLRLTRAEQRLAGAANGRSAERLLRSVQRTLGGPDQARATLEALVAKGILRWSAPVTVSLEPERLWRNTSPRVEALEELIVAREAVAGAAGDANRLLNALASLERVFEAKAGVPSRRHEGRTYAGRGLVFEECRRGLDFELGPTPIERVAPALRVVLAVARWYTFAVARAMTQALLRCHRRLGGGPIPLHVFHAATASVFDHEVPPAVQAVMRRLRIRWKRIWNLATCDADGTQHLSVEKASQLVQREFAAPCPGWPGARHHAPDLMWESASAEQLLHGEGMPILAELHPGVSPFTTLSVLSLCPWRRELEREWTADFAPGLVSPIPWEAFARSSQDARLAQRHWHLDMGGEFVSERPPRQVLRAADFDVLPRGRRLVARHRTTRDLEFDLVEVFERRIKLRAASAFSLADGAERGPRRFIGPLLVQRAHWRVAAGPEVTREQVLAWRGQHSLPDRVFVRSPEEVKPVYIDFASRLSVEMLTRLAHHASFLDISEMCPGPQGLWLRDELGNRYVAELRLIAVDPMCFDPELVWAG